MEGLINEDVWTDTCIHDKDERPLCSECEMENRCLVNEVGEASIKVSDKEKLAEEFGR